MNRDRCSVWWCAVFHGLLHQIHVPARHTFHSFTPPCTSSTLLPFLPVLLSFIPLYISKISIPSSNPAAYSCVVCFMFRVLHNLTLFVLQEPASTSVCLLVSYLISVCKLREILIVFWEKFVDCQTQDVEKLFNPWVTLLPYMFPNL